jgi:hypothetical protein
MTSLRGRPSVIGNNALITSNAAAVAAIPSSPDRTSSSNSNNKHGTFQTLAASPSPKSSSRHRGNGISRFRLWWSISSTSRKAFVVALAGVTTFFSCISILDALFYSYNSPEIPSQIFDQEFSVVINTFKRPQMLSQAVQHYAEHCGRKSGVAQVFVIWAEQDNAPPDPSTFFPPYTALKGFTKDVTDNRSSIQIIKVPDSLNSRFLPIPQMTTTALFMVDDDVRVDCGSLAQAFLAWKAYPDSMVGFYPRLATPSRKYSDGGYIEHCWPIVFLRQRVNFVLTKASFLHRRYLDLYSSNQKHPQEIKDYVDEHMNCEDFAMSLLVANVTRFENKNKQQRSAMPIYVEGSISDQGLFGGISTKGGFVGRRAQCLTDLSRIYKEKWNASPLDDTYSLREVSWTRHFPGFWWQFCPSNPFEWGALLDFFQ